MVKNGIFEGIYQSEQGRPGKNAGCVKIARGQDGWHLKIDIRGFYSDAASVLEVSYFIGTELKTYIFPVGVVTVKNGVGQAAFLLEAQEKLPEEYRFEHADGLYVGDWQETGLLFAAVWDHAEHHGNKRERYQMGAEASGGKFQEAEQVQEGKTAEPEKHAEMKTAEMPPPIQMISTRKEKSLIERFEEEESGDIFNDDEFADCMEITPQQLQEMTGLENPVAGNSFLLHAYFKYHHILLARPTDPKKESMVFIGAPGVYSNRERYLASLFGLRNFKKSCRSDYDNPNFGYWYAEIYI